jgi:hypothetical protein
VCTQTGGVKQKIREHKLRIGLNCQGVLKEKGVKQVGVQQGRGAHKFVNGPGDVWLQFLIAN